MCAQDRRKNNLTLADWRMWRDVRQKWSSMRLTVRRVVEAVALYPNRDGRFRNYPEPEPDDVQRALAFAAANLEDSAAESNAA